ncbi:MAG: hypothetical protein IJ797_07615, partial [Selenomonadaceae bacterium]|nr:hypothetical protein [Selenomonadaceae bacterium]
LKMYQEIYVKEHGYQKFCKKYPNGSEEDCKECIEKCKLKNSVPAMICPTYPLYSDNVTKVLSFKDLFEVNAGENQGRNEITEIIEADGENLGGEVRESKVEESQSEIEKRKIAEKIISSYQFCNGNSKIVIFDESLYAMREYEESWELCENECSHVYAASIS